MNGLTRCDEPRGVLIGPITLTGQLYYSLLYPSDAADEEDSVDLGGRRISYKKLTLPTIHHLYLHP